MAFNDDNGGFAFSCNDAKFSLCASTWNTKLSQLGKLQGAVCIMTHHLTNVEYISRILSKRPSNIYIIAHEEAKENAIKIKRSFPMIRLALHKKINAKIVLVEPETVWVSSADFGESKMLESAVGFHSVDVYNRTLEKLFRREWLNSIELV